MFMFFFYLGLSEHHLQNTRHAPLKIPRASQKCAALLTSRWSCWSLTVVEAQAFWWVNLKWRPRSLQQIENQSCCDEFNFLRGCVVSIEAEGYLWDSVVPLVTDKRIFLFVQHLIFFNSIFILLHTISYDKSSVSYWTLSYCHIQAPFSYSWIGFRPSWALSSLGSV